jgi:dihydroorotase (multifunctional complex type)
MKVDLVIKNCRLVTPLGVTEAGVAVEDGKIVAVARDTHLPRADRVLDLMGRPVLSGVLDGHCHATSPPDVPESTTFAAASGGVTTIHDMPGYQVPTFSPEDYEAKQRSFEGNCYVDYTFHGACASGYPKGTLTGIWALGATGIKFFVSDPGPGWPQTFDGEILEGFKELASISGLALIHAENDHIIKDNRKRLKAQGRRDYAAYLRERPRLAEVEAGRRIIQYLEETGCTGLIVHTSVPETVYEAMEAKRRGVRVYIETCPQYLYLTVDDVKQRGPWVKFAPPARPRETVNEMRRLLEAGLIDTVATDHAPFTREEKQVGITDILEAPNGIPGLDTFMPLMLNSVSESWLSLPRLAAVVSENPARIFGVYPCKGSFRVGSDADFVVLDMTKEYTIRGEDQVSACGWTPYEGLLVKGAPCMSIIRGETVMSEGEVLAEKGYGRYIPRRSP